MVICDCRGMVAARATPAPLFKQRRAVNLATFGTGYPSSTVPFLIAVVGTRAVLNSPIRSTTRFTYPLPCGRPRGPFISVLDGLSYVYFTGGTSVSDLYVYTVRIYTIVSQL